MITDELDKALMAQFVMGKMLGEENAISSYLDLSDDLSIARLQDLAPTWKFLFAHGLAIILIGLHVK
jgi:hypothetical protein